MPQNLNPPLSTPSLSRDPYRTPLTSFPPEFIPTLKVTEEMLKVVKFCPPGWLSKEELKLLKHVIKLRKGSLAFSAEERGIFKYSYGKPYIIPVNKHDPWQQKPIPIPAAIKPDFIELVRERIKNWVL